MTDVLRELRDKVSAGGLVSMPYDAYGPIRIMAWCENYAMVRRPGCGPFIRRRKELLAILDALIQGDKADG